MTDDRLAVGLVRGVHGLRGAVRVEILSDNAARFEPGSVVYPEGSERPLTIASAHRDGPGLLVRFREVHDRPTADTLREKYLEIEPAASDLPAETYYWHEIIGCTVTTESGLDLGTVSDVFRVGESEVYTVQGPRGEVLVPAVSAIVTKLDPRKKSIVVNGAALGFTE
ncbi:MAG: ribosome maturation factor RimM [Chloroflexota bacterium]|nr:ribosome maturation factor RimM [Chloroflexota bacterium]